MNNSYILATSTFCGPCQMIKKFLTQNNLCVRIVNMEDDMQFFADNVIKSVPVLLCSDGTRFAGAGAILSHFSQYKPSNNQ